MNVRKGYSEKTLKNSAFSVLAQLLTFLLQFVNRKVFILFLDIEYLGYQSLFGNVFSLLSVAEFGLSSIIAVYLYREIAEKNDDEISKLMYLYKLMFRVIAGVVCVAGIICSLLLPFIVKDAKVSWNYVLVIYFMQLFSVVAGYFLSYKRIMYIVTMQEFKCIRIDIIVTILMQILQICLLAIFKNYLLYLAVQLSTTIISNIIIAVQFKKDFPNVGDKCNISKEYLVEKNLFHDMRDIAIHKVSQVVYGGTDSIIISAFCGVRSVGLYGNYVLVEKGVMQILFYKLLNPIQAALGNIVNSKRSKQNMWNQFEMLDMFSFLFASYIGIGFLVLFQPFIELWLGKEYLLPNAFVVLYSITIYLNAVWEIVYKYRSVFADYKQDRSMMLLSAILNIIISIVGVKYYGIAGIQFGTLIAFLPIALGRIRFVVGGYFKKSVLFYLLKHVGLLVLAMIEAVICYYICAAFDVCVTGFVLRIMVWLIIPIVISGLILYRNEHFQDLFKYIKKIFDMKILRKKAD